MQNWLPVWKMNLHLDRDAFETLLLDIQERTGVRADILEKDYYVTLMLKELAANQSDLHAYFKGGTALYKALGTIRRFSEDIDLTVEIQDCLSKTQAAKRLKSAAKGYLCLERLEEECEDKKGSVTAVYKYGSIIEVDESDSLQRFGRVKIEATSFTVSEPMDLMVISPTIYELAVKEQKGILENTFDVAPFEIGTIKLERIFVDKLFASEFYFSRSMFFDVAKHIYDITVLFDNERIKKMLGNKAALAQMIQYKRREELVRAGGVPADIPIHKFSYMDALFNSTDFLREFDHMQSIYVFDESDNIPVSLLKETISAIKDILIDYDL